MSKVEKMFLAEGLEVPRVITGLWQIADMEKDGKTLDPEKLSKFMQPYVDAGLTTFDMADHYGSAEVIAGYYQKNHDPAKISRMFTKWVPKPGPISRDDVRAAVNERLTRLQTSRIDLLQYHAWNFSNPYWLDTLLYLQELQQEGIIGALGTTNFDTAHIRIAKSAGVNIATNQISYSLIDRRGGAQMAEYCDENGVKILAYGTLCGGFISKRWLGQREPSLDELTTWSLMKYKRFIDSAGGWDKFQEVLSVINDIAEENNKSISVIASKYQLTRKAVGAVIIGARLGENSHIADSVSLFSFDFTKDQISRIERVLETLSPIPGDCGDEYRRPPYLTASGDLSHHLDKFPPVYKVTEQNDRSFIDSGTTWEALAGYSRAMRIGDRILVSGTTATHGTTLIGAKDPIAQTHFVIDKIEAAIESLGGKLSDVVRTRIFCHDLKYWEEIARVHGERFADIRPANTMVEAKLIGDGYLVEIEVEAITQ
jgi:aryl-alcohol dehydrogenase-like predicted oxidoreductase/enamine deaminase RidA (YjgF/YER057c/UK114 family)